MPRVDPVARRAARDFQRRLSALAPAPAGDPLAGVRAGADTEADDRAELEAVRAALKTADRRVEEVSGNEFYCSLVFLTREQRDAFLAAVGWPSVEGGRYIDGLAAAERLGVPLPPAKPTAIRPAGGDRKAVAVGLIDDYPQ